MVCVETARLVRPFRLPSLDPSPPHPRIIHGVCSCLLFPSISMALSYSSSLNPHAHFPQQQELAADCEQIKRHAKSSWSPHLSPFRPGSLPLRQSLGHWSAKIDSTSNFVLLCICCFRNYHCFSQVFKWVQNSQTWWWWEVSGPDPSFFLWQVFPLC